MAGATTQGANLLIRGNHHLYTVDATGAIWGILETLLNKTSRQSPSERCVCLDFLSCDSSCCFVKSYINQFYLSFSCLCLIESFERPLSFMLPADLHDEDQTELLKTVSRQHNRLTDSLVLPFSRKEKMICRILLLISLTSCVSGTFEVKVTQSSYQAEENHNITLEWTFPTKPDSSSSSLNIYCELFTDHNDPVLYHVHEGVEVPESQDEQFAGRVQSDKDALREGRIRLHVSRLRTEDSGLYICEVKTDDGVSSDRCHLNVTEAVGQPDPQKSIERPQPESQLRTGLHVGLTAAVLVVCAGLCFAFILCLTKCPDKTGHRFKPLLSSCKSSKSEQTAVNMAV